MHINRTDTKMNSISLSKSTIAMYKEMHKLHVAWFNVYMRLSIVESNKLSDRLTDLRDSLKGMGLSCKDCYYHMHWSNNVHYCMLNIKNYDPTKSDPTDNFNTILGDDSETVWSCLELDLKGHDDPLKGFQLF